MTWWVEPLYAALTLPPAYLLTIYLHEYGHARELERITGKKTTIQREGIRYWYVETPINLPVQDLRRVLVNGIHGGAIPALLYAAVSAGVGMEYTALVLPYVYLLGIIPDLRLLWGLRHVE